MAPLFIFEGPDGIGKTTLSMRLAAYLQERGLPCEYLSFPGREPGTLGHLVYELHHQPTKHGVGRIDPTSRQILHIAAHVDAVEMRIRPLLTAGTTVVLDRFWWSTWVYGRTTGAPVNSLEKMIELEKQHWRDIQPACLFLVTRTQSVRSEQSACDFRELSETYRVLAERERGVHRILHVATDGPVEDSFSTVLREIETMPVEHATKTNDGK